MAGISSKAAGGVANNKKYNGYEFNGDFDINLYETFYRSHDPQIGRFWQIDPKAINEEGPYVAMGNNPILYFDLLGDDIDIGTNQESKDDIMSLVAKKNKDIVKISDKGKVTLDYGNRSKKEINKLLRKDDGLKLVSDLVNAKEKYYYESSEIFTARKDDGSKTSGYSGVIGNNGIVNASNNGKDSEGQNAIRPMSGYDGQVVVNPFSSSDELDENYKFVSKPRHTVVFHELAENFERTTNSIDYQDKGKTRGAHNLAVDRESKWSNRSSATDPGAVKSYRTKMPNEDARKAYNIILEKYMKN